MVISETPSSSPKENPSSQASGFSSSSSIDYIQFLQKALFRIGMERIVPNTNSRRNSTGNIAFDPTGYREVLTRYQPPFSSTHDNYKPFLLDLPLEPKPATPAPEKPSPKTPSTSNKLYAPVPRPATKDVKISNTSLLKHQIKPAPIEGKAQDFKSKIKSKPDMDDPFYLPPTRLNRRYSEVIIPTTGLGDVLNSHAVGGGLTRTNKTIHNKTELKKNPKPPSSVKTATKPPENNGKIPRKVQALKDKVGSTADQGSRKSKPVGEVQEKKTDKTSVLSRNEKKGSRNGQNGAQIDSSLKKDETLQREEQKNGITSLELKKDETLQREEQKNGITSLELKKDETLQREEQKNGITSLEFKKTENKTQIPSSDSSTNEERLSENGQDGARISSSSEKDKTLQKDEQNNRIAASEVVKTENKTQIPTSGHDESQIHETLQRDGKKNETTSLVVKKTENKTQIPASCQNRSAVSLPPKNGMTSLDVKKPEKPTRVKRLTAENGKCSPRTRQRRSFDSDFGCGSPKKQKFEQGKVADENQTSPFSRMSLRRLSSDNVLQNFHSHSPPTVALKPCETETNKIHLGLNNVIEETASKLIQTRKSKVKALVGAFEMISSNDPKSKV